MKHITIFLLFFLLGCEARIVYMDKGVGVTIPADARVPVISRKELGCLPDEVYEKITDRDIIRKNQIQHLKNLLKISQSEDD